LEPTIFRLFSEGAHHVVSSILQYGLKTLREIFIALRLRFGWLTEPDLPAVGALVREVNRAALAGNNMGRRQSPMPMSYGINPALPDNYQYVTIGYIRDPKNEGKETSIPWTINNPTPLSYEEILQRAEDELNESFDRGNKYMSASYADLHRRDVLFQRIREEEYGGHAPLDIIIREIYRRG
jgi:hypothetical protein